MSCIKCEEAQDSGMVAYVRIDKANVGLTGCDEHLRIALDRISPRVAPRAPGAKGETYTLEEHLREFVKPDKWVHVAFRIRFNSDANKGWEIMSPPIVDGASGVTEESPKNQSNKVDKEKHE